MLHCSAVDGQLYLWSPDVTGSFTAWLPEGERRVDAKPVDWRLQREGFWGLVGLFAFGLMERRSFVPSVRRRKDGLTGNWSSRYLGEDRGIFEELVAMMPDSARALSAGVPRRKVLHAAIEGMVDGMVREIAQDRMYRFPASTVYAKWQMALSQKIQTMPGDRGTLERFQFGIVDWQRELDLESTHGYRVGFRIRETEQPAKWLVEHFLEDALRGGRFSFVDLAGEDLRDKRTVLDLASRSLEKAIEIYPALVNVDVEAHRGIELSQQRTIEFLARFAPQLEAVGFPVEKPDWWTENAGAHVEMIGTLEAPGAEAPSEGAMQTKVKLSWAALLGDEPLSLVEMSQMLQNGGEIQRVKGRWMRVNLPSVSEAMTFMRGGPERKLTVREALREVLGLGAAGRGMDVQEIRTKGWVGDLLKRLRDPAKIKELPAPAGLKGKLRHYQVRGYSWLNYLTGFGLGACLADDMGLGKSIQMLALIAERRVEKKPTLLVCPTSVIGNWEREVARFFPEIRTMVHHGPGRAKGQNFVETAAGHDLVLTSYSLVDRDVETFQMVPWDGVVLDEAQNIKNFETKQSRAARKIKGAYRVALTGTPVENHVGDLYSLMDFLNPGLLGSVREFNTNFFKPIQNGRTRATQQLRSLTAPFLLRRLKTDKSVIADLPEKMEMKVYCKLTQEQVTLYEEVRQGLFDGLNGSSRMERKGMILATISRLKQVCNHPAQLLKEREGLDGRSGKLKRLTEMLEEVREVGEKALIFSQFAEMGDILSRHLREKFGDTVVFLHGGTPRKERERMIAAFGEESGPALFVLSLKAGGTGLNLVAANHVFHFDRWWNPAVENQATDRAFRIGQTKRVQVHKFICMGTLEERIDQMVEMKKELADRVVEAGEVWLTELSNTELRDLFALSREAWED